MAIFTIGHSNRTLEQFLELLTAQGVSLLVDVRTMPRSRYNPQFNRDTLPHMLAAQSIGYEHMPGLGGLRHPRKDSVNTGWRNASFRGYADFMQTEEFARSLASLRKLASGQRTAIMCAEAVPWRCHRSLIADALTIGGVPVTHILSAGKTEPHQLTSFARVEGARITYPGPELELFGPDATT
jgi:uncharacterized protein (DUF488 family)